MIETCNCRWNLQIDYSRKRKLRGKKNPNNWIEGIYHSGMSRCKAQRPWLQDQAAVHSPEDTHCMMASTGRDSSRMYFLPVLCLHVIDLLPPRLNWNRRPEAGCMYYASCQFCGTGAVSVELQLRSIETALRFFSRIPTFYFSFPHLDFPLSYFFHFSYLFIFFLFSKLLFYSYILSSVHTLLPSMCWCF